MYDCDQIQWSPISSALTAVEPATPTNLAHYVDVRYKEKVVVTWDPVTDNGASVLSKYVIAIKDDGGSETESDVSTYATSYTFSSLTPGDKYQVRIKSVNLVGESDWTEYVDCYPG